MDVAHFYLEGNADAVAFCPHEGYQHVLAASTYTLQEGDQPSRAGSISLFDVNAEKGSIELFHRVDTAGIFYISWSPVGGNVGPLLAQAYADGYLRIYRLEGYSDEEKAKVYTGSDYCKFSCWDIQDNPSVVVFQNSKVHKMGVFCIAKSPNNQNTILTGSYDEYLRVWDLRSIARPINETSVSLGGRSLENQAPPFCNRPGLVLAACMYNGFAIVNIEGEKLEVVETYHQHGSLALQKMENTAGIELNLEVAREFEILIGCSPSCWNWNQSAKDEYLEKQEDEDIEEGEIELFHN